MVGGAFAYEKFAGGDVEKRKSDCCFAEMHGCKKIVFAMIEHIVAKGHAGGDELGDAALYKFFCEFGVFELLADGDTLSGADKFRQIGVESMVRKTGKLDILRRTVGAAGEGYAQYFGCGDGVVGKSFVEVADTEQQYCVGMLCFHLDILLHQRCFNNFFGHGEIYLRKFTHFFCTSALRGPKMVLFGRCLEADSDRYAHGAPPGVRFYRKAGFGAVFDCGARVFCGRQLLQRVQVDEQGAHS